MKNIHVIALLVLAIGAVSGLAVAQTYVGAGAGAGTAGSYAGQVASVSAGPGGTQSFSLGSGYMYSMMSVGPQDAARLQNEGVRTVVVPAGSMVHVTVQTGQPMAINTGQGQTPNMIVFGPGGLVGVGVWTGQGTGAYAGAGGAAAGTGAGAGTIVLPGGTMQMYSFSGSPGQAFLVTQQSGGRTDRALVVFQ
jgi:hypothetical protein